MKHTIKKLPKSQVAIAVSLPEDVFTSYKNKAIANLGEHIEVPGFRKGKAPAHVVEKELKQLHVLEEMADLSISEHLPKILIDEKIDAIGRPIIQITKIAEGNPFEFTATVAVLPEIKLPDYAKIAKNTQGDDEDTTVSDEELDKAIIELKRARKHQEMHANNTPHNEDEIQKEEVDATLTEDYVKGLGDFESVTAFKEKFRENIKNEKDARVREKRRIAILEAIIEKTEVDLPDILIDNELENLIARMKSDIGRMGMQFEDYMKHIQKTEEDMRGDLRPDAEKKAKSELVMYEIAKREKLAPTPEAIDKETEQVLGFYKDADKERTRAYVTHLLTNEEVFKFLETSN